VGLSAFYRGGGVAAVPVGADVHVDGGRGRRGKNERKGG